MLKKSRTLLGWLFAIGVAVEFLEIQPAQGLVSKAQAAERDINFRSIINLAGRQRMLSQKMSKEFMLVALGHDTRENLQNLEESRETFYRVLWGLRFGDPELALQAVDAFEVQGKLSEVYTLWPEYEELLDGDALARGISADLVSAVAARRLPLLEAMHSAVVAYEELSRQSMKTFSLAERLVNIAGRQRMLTQKMATEYLLVKYGYKVEIRRKKLAETMAMFETYLDALLSGKPDERIIPAPNAEIRAQLGAVYQLWRAFKPMMEEALETREVDSATLTEMASLNLTLLSEMNKAVSLYESK